MIANFKEQIEAPLTDEEQTKLAALRSDIQIGIDQLDRGECVRDFDIDAFLAERHQEFAARKGA